MKENLDFVAEFDRSIMALFRNALKISLHNPPFAAFLLKAICNQRNASKRRDRLQQSEGIRIPPFLIASITRQCNLHCHGCYAKAQHRPGSAAELSPDRMTELFREARNLGVSIILLAGGEPLMRPELLGVTVGFPEIIFPIFTNGLLIDQEKTAAFAKQRHVVPVISLEGVEEQTDDRRGKGVYQRLESTFAMLRKAGIFFGTSITLTRENFDTVTSDGFVQRLLSKGMQLIFYVEYIPVQEGTEHLVLTEAQRTLTQTTLTQSLSRKYPGLFIAFPGDEKQYGGCLAAGRGFVHVSPEGHVEPCPFAPVSDSGLQGMSLKEALQSDLLRIIRENSDELHDTSGGCALWNRRDLVQSLVKKDMPYC
ncbi:MAG TPA: radical SAM protein [Firmicutes bacterium]|jgi:MoaA/NifB/PqqE/SkfB family radical SAM enzyme|nr:radical SAM protein [Bacillota bacterium]HBG43304.1 radical SAM protein [Bacillota bacterium]HBL67132.1 radical SAM protein [Bacillota bacterium]HBR23974.1 radical SAM protein [Bacillota bacterium]HCF89376.1 radical SAM protein [Bacillota bacterium]